MPYESNVIFVKDYKETAGSFKFLHNDYLGSILAITDRIGNKIEQRHYDAWGNLTHLQIGNGEILTDKERIANSDLLIARGYTSHEHFFEVGIIHMNGRLYDPLLRRFLNADEHIQDPYNTQNYNKYGYVYNNPLMYNDPSGEFIGIVLAIVTSKLFLVGAAVGAATYIITSAIKGTPITLKGFLGSALKMGLAFYMGGMLNPGSFSLSTGELLLQGVGQVVSSVLPSWEINIGDFSFNISPSIAIGKGWGFGANVSATFHAGDFSFSAGFGLMHYGAHAGSGESGWEYRKSAMLNYDNGNWGLSLGTNKWKGLHEQQTGILGFRHGDFSMSYENDGAPFDKKSIPKNLLAGGTDKYRTAAMRFQIGDFQAGFNLFTGDRDLSKDGNFSYRDDFGRKHRNGAAYEVGPRYRLGAAYVGWGNYRIGTNSEHIRHAIQNVVAHHVLSPQGSFENLSWDWKFYFQYQTKNKFTSW